MGKKAKTLPVEEDKVEQNQNQQPGEKTSLHQFLPHTKYIHKKNIILKKKKNLAVKTVNLDKFQIKKAVDCLLKFAQQHKNPADLFGEEGFIYLEIDTSKVPEDYSIRPTRIKLPVPIYSKQLNSRFTVFSAEPEADFTDIISQMQVPMIRQVIGYNKVKKNFKQLKDKRSLLSANDLFFCDWKIYNLLRQPLGKLFYQKKKFPYPIDCSGQVPEQFKEQYQDYQSYINGLADYTYFMMGNGPVYTIKVGRTNMVTKDLVKNIINGAYNLIAQITSSDNNVQPDNIRQIGIKTHNSPCLPIFNNLSKAELKAYKKHNNKTK